MPKKKYPVSVTVALSAAVISVALAFWIRSQHPKQDHLANILLGAWALVPPIWFIVEWHLFDSKAAGHEATDDFKHGQELARNVWLALVVVLAVVMRAKWGVGD